VAPTSTASRQGKGERDKKGEIEKHSHRQRLGLSAEDAATLSRPDVAHIHSPGEADTMSFIAAELIERKVLE
jgi:hypothetical protein